MKKLIVILTSLLTIGACSTTNTTVEVEPASQTFTFNHTDLKCLADNVYHESRGETVDGQIAVARVTLNRLVSQIKPFNKYKNVCDVVYDGGYGKEGNTTCQFAWTCDSIPDVVTDTGYEDYVKEFIFLNAIALEGWDCVLYYHADDGRERGWITRGKLVNPFKVDNHLFYKDPSCK